MAHPNTRRSDTALFSLKKVAPYTNSSQIVAFFSLPPPAPRAVAMNGASEARSTFTIRRASTRGCYASFVELTRCEREERV